MTPDEISAARRLQREVKAAEDRVEASLFDAAITSERFEALVQQADAAQDAFFAHLRACRP
jgi:hypothetical protein